MKNLEDTVPVLIVSLKVHQNQLANFGRGSERRGSPFHEFEVFDQGILSSQPLGSFGSFRPISTKISTNFKRVRT
jgi:hypothetical protein